MSFSPSSGASVCKIALIDDSDHVTFYETTNTSIGVKIDPNKLMRWNVASLCNSGFHNWNTTRALNFSPTGIKINATEKISIYPNPCNDFIQVDLTKIQHEKITIAVFNLIGEVVFTSDRLPSDGRIETKGLSKGWYQLRIDYGGKQFVSSFIKD